jgi:hypothetical protein
MLELKLGAEVVDLSISWEHGLLTCSFRKVNLQDMPIADIIRAMDMCTRNVPKQNADVPT